MDKDRVEKVYKRIDERHGGSDLVGAVLGLTAEAGEVAQLMRDCVDSGRSKRLNYGELAMELCDVAHYLAMACNVLRCSLDDLLMLNDAKMDALDAGERRYFEQCMCGWKDSVKPLREMVSEVQGHIQPLPHFEH